jgi:hypothetical protein
MLQELHSTAETVRHFLRLKTPRTDFITYLLTALSYHTALLVASVRELPIADGPAKKARQVQREA